MIASTSRRRGMRLVVAMALTAAAISSGCGATTRAPRRGPTQVVMMEFRLRPDRITAPAGSLTLIVHNLGRQTHDLDVSSASQTVASTQPIAPGGSARLNVKLPPGTYLIASSIQADQALGLRGTLQITPRR